MGNTNVPDGNAFTDEMEINLNMFCGLVLERVDREVNSVDVIAIYEEGTPGDRVVEFLKKLMEPTRSATQFAMTRYSTLALEWETKD